MTEPTILTSYLKQLPSLRPDLAVVWPLDFTRVTLTSVTVFGLSADQTAFHTGWSFEYAPPVATDGEIQAMFVGTIKWTASLDGGPALILESYNFATMMLPQFDLPGLPKLPGWWPQCRFLLYDQLDWGRVRTALTNLVNNLSPVVRQQLEADQPVLTGATADQIVRWFLGESHQGQTVDFALPLVPGDVIGGGEDMPGGVRRARFRAKENLDDPFFLNLGFYANAFSQLGFLDGSAVPDASLLNSLLSHEVPLVASGTIRSVAGGSGNSVQAAVQTAAPGDVILIADAGPYQAPSVIDIQKPLSLIGAIAGDALASSAPTLPIIRGNRPPDGQRHTTAWATAAHGALRVSNAVTGDDGKGMITIANLRFENGADRQGGGIFINEVHRVWIHNCAFTDNVAYAGGWLYEGFGGAICLRHAGILIDNCLFIDNEANGRGGALGVFGYGWPVIQKCRFENNRAERLNIINPATSQPFFSRPDGGALAIQMATPNTEDRFAHIAAVAPAFEGLSITEAATMAQQMVNNGQLTTDDFILFKDLLFGRIDNYWDTDKLAASHESSVQLRENMFEGNISGDDGGAIYATGLVRGLCENNIITGNAAGSNGGGLRISTACDFLVEGGQIMNNQSNRNLWGYRCERDRKDNNWKYTWITYAGGGNR